MPAVHPILLLRECHASDDEYLTFCDGALTRTIVALVQASGKDILWKNFNHKILLACRDSRACVRLMAANLLHSLFTQVGGYLYYFLCLSLYVSDSIKY